MSKKIVIVNKKERDEEEGEDSKEQGTSKSEIEKEERKTFNKEEMKSMEGDNFEKMFEESMLSFERGQIVEGVIVGIEDRGIFVDVGYKLEGIIRQEEFMEEPKLGQKIKVKVMLIDDEHDRLLLSKREADMIEGKALLAKTYENQTTVEGVIKREIKGGYKVDVKGVDCFLPLSQVDIKRVEEPKEHVGKSYIFQISKYEPENNNVVLSRKAHLEVERGKRREIFFNKVKEGETISGRVKKVESYGIFVNLEEGIDGFSHIKDLSWSHIKDSHSVVKEGDEHEFKILKVDQENQKINLGLKQLTEDPWDIYAKTHKTGDVVTGEVLRMVNFGAFINLTDGVDGLLHIKELSWTKRVNHPEEVLKIGDMLQIKILTLDKEERRISLSLKEVLDNPWEDVEEEYAEGKLVDGVVKSITAFGVFIELKTGLQGLLHKDNIDWTKKQSNPESHGLKEGDKLTLKVLKSSKEERIISLGLKQLEDNPWMLFRKEHPEGSIIKGTVDRFGDNGVYLKLEDKGLEGFLHAADMLKRKEETVEDIYKEGMEVEGSIKHIDVNRNRINITVKGLEKRREAEVLKKYVVKDSKKVTEGGATLGDFMNQDKKDTTD